MIENKDKKEIIDKRLEAIDHPVRKFLLLFIYIYEPVMITAIKHYFQIKDDLLYGYLEKLENANLIEKNPNPKIEAIPEYKATNVTDNYIKKTSIEHFFAGFGNKWPRMHWEGYTP